MLNAKSSENFLSPDQNWANFGGFVGLGVSKSCDFYSTSFEPFCVKIGGGV